MKGIVHEPQVNIGADQKFSPVDVFKQKKKETNPGIYMDWLNVKRLHCRYSKMVKWLNQT